MGRMVSGSEIYCVTAWLFEVMCNKRFFGLRFRGMKNWGKWTFLY